MKWILFLPYAIVGVITVAAQDSTTEVQLETSETTESSQETPPSPSPPPNPQSGRPNSNQPSGRPPSKRPSGSPPSKRPSGSPPSKRPSGSPPPKPESSSRASDRRTGSDRNRTTTTTDPSPGLVKCYECNGLECNKGQCEGVWCKKTTIKGSGTPEVKYHCEDIKTVAFGCSDVRLWGYVIHQCFCKDRDFCTTQFDTEDYGEEHEEADNAAPANTKLEFQTLCMICYTVTAVLFSLI